MNSQTLSIIIANLPLLRGHAYLDPGSGSFLIQLLIAGLVGVGFFVRSKWARIKAYFNRSSKNEPEKPDDTDQPG